MSTDITAPEQPATPILDRRTGEIHPLELSELETLAAIASDIAERRQAFEDEEALVLGELLARLDRRQLWTLRVGDPEDGVQYELKAASPTAGTVGYDAAKLREQLVQLLADNQIDQEAARAVLKRSVSIVAYVNPHVDLEALQAKLERLDGIAGVLVYDVHVSTNEQAVAAGVKRLEAAGHGEAVARCRVTVPAPSRKVKVKRIEAKR